MINLPLLDQIAARIIIDGISEWPESGRSCGECQACCECMTVRDFPDKGKWQRCTHQCASGCDIYESRPVTCRDFQCGWRSGILADPQPDNRPDRLGLIICLDSDGCPDAVHAHECWPWAHKEPRAEILLHRLATRWVVVLHEHGTDRLSLYGTSERAAAWLERFCPDLPEDVKRRIAGAA